MRTNSKSKEKKAPDGAKSGRRSQQLSLSKRSSVASGSERGKEKTPTGGPAKGKSPAKRRQSKVHLANLAKLKKEHAEAEREKEHISHLQDLAMNRNTRRAKDQEEESRRQLALQHLVVLEEKRAHR